MRVEDVMTKDVKTVRPDTPLREVARILAEGKISGVPVVEDGKLVGVVSESDILVKERGERPGRGGLLGLIVDEGRELQTKLQARSAGEAMTSPAITIGPKRTVTEAASKMVEEKVNRLPVVDDKGNLVGIVTRADLVRAFVRSDEEIAREIREDVVFRTLWIPPEQVEVAVERGVVTLRGHVENRSDAELLPSFVQRVPGVIAVESYLTWEDEDGRRARKA